MIHYASVGWFSVLTINIMGLSFKYERLHRLAHATLKVWRRVVLEFDRVEFGDAPGFADIGGEP